MFFLQLTLLTLCASASLLNVRRDIEPAEEDLMDITVDLSGIDSALPTFVSQNSTADQAQNIDKQFGIVTAFANNASMHVLAYVSLNGPTTPDDAEESIWKQVTSFMSSTRPSPPGPRSPLPRTSCPCP
ncbi:hypothetical protein C8R44DRAFT_860485 [Mycena epipterygia]|nr:hypothetical protein C8R44DRAFT_860485 [Mycena epipterygia]